MEEQRDRSSQSSDGDDHNATEQPRPEELSTGAVSEFEFDLSGLGDLASFEMDWSNGLEGPFPQLGHWAGAFREESAPTFEPDPFSTPGDAGLSGNQHSLGGALKLGPQSDADTTPNDGSGTTNDSMPATAPENPIPQHQEVIRAPDGTQYDWSVPDGYTLSPLPNVGHTQPQTDGRSLAPVVTFFPGTESHTKPASQKAAPNPRKKKAKDADDDPLRGAKSWGFHIPAGPGIMEINCTAVEIIVFLPKWYQNRSLANRFINNGMRPPIHVRMLRTHRVGDFKRNSIMTGYRNAMRGHDWDKGGVRLKKDWEARRKDAESKGQPFNEPPPLDDPQWKWCLTTHEVPAGWNSANISVNGFVPDGIRGAKYKEPPPFPFRLLTKDVKKFPEGPDSADLTRAVAFAMTNLRNGTEEYMFPIHWHEILNLIGRTQITPAHLDPACIQRYKELDENYGARNNGDGYSQGEGHVGGDPSQASPQTHMPAPGQVPPPLIRNDPAPPEDDFSDIAQIVRYSQLPEQAVLDWVWDTGHVVQITDTLTVMWINHLNSLLDQSSRPLWREVDFTYLSYGTDPILAFANAQHLIHWRVELEHAYVMSYVNMSEPHMTLQALADVVLNFQQYAQAVNPAHIDGWRFREATLEAIHMFGLDAGGPNNQQDGPSGQSP